MWMRPTALCQLRSGTEKTSDIFYDLAGAESCVTTQDNHDTVQGNTSQHYTVKYSQPIGMLHRTAYPAPPKTTHYNTTQDNHNTTQGNTTDHYTMKSFDPGFNSPFEYQEYFLGGKGDR